MMEFVAMTVVALLIVAMVYAGIRWLTSDEDDEWVD